MKIDFNKKHRIFFVLIYLSIILFVSVALGLGNIYMVKAEEINTGGTTAFSQKTKEECIEFIINNDITIPNDFIDNADLGRI